MDAHHNQSYSVIGKRHVRKGVPEKATGQAKYTADISFPDMLEGAVLCSPLAHARILNIDTSKARRLSGRLTLWTSTQVSHYVQRTLAIALKMPVDHIRVIAPCVGGGFGPKASTNPYEPITCFLAKVTRKPVRVVLDREQVFWHNRARHKFVHEMKTAVDRDGYLLGLEHLSVMDGGAYSSFGVITAYYDGSLLTGPYRLPAMKYDGIRVYTNKPASGSLRGHGGISNRVCFEAQLDMIARDIGIDPIELRLKNRMHHNDTTCCGYYAGNLSVGECLEAARNDAKWSEKKASFQKIRVLAWQPDFLFPAQAPVCIEPTFRIQPLFSGWPMMAAGYPPFPDPMNWARGRTRSLPCLLPKSWGFRSMTSMSYPVIPGCVPWIWELIPAGRPS